VIVDEAFNPNRGRGCYQLNRVHHVDGHTLRVRVYRDSYQVQSTATVGVLTPELTWTVLADQPPEDWWHTTEQAANRTALTAVADRLVDRARAILHRPRRPIPNRRTT
jgi:hypothetical protein